MLSFLEHFSEVEAFYWHFVRKQFRPIVNLISSFFLFSFKSEDPNVRAEMEDDSDESEDEDLEKQEKADSGDEKNGGENCDELSCSNKGNDLPVEEGGKHTLLSVNQDHDEKKQKLIAKFTQSKGWNQSLHLASSFHASAC